MGQDTHNITGVSAPIKFTYANWPLIYKAMTADETICILMLTEPETGRDECYNITDTLFEYFTENKPSSQVEFESYAAQATTELHRRKLLTPEHTLSGQELHVFAEIMDCHSRNLSRRARRYLFNQEMGYTPSAYIDIVKKQTSALTKLGIPKSAITINTYVWDD